MDKKRNRVFRILALSCLLLIAAVWIILPPRMQKHYDLVGNGTLSLTVREAGDFGLVTEGPGMVLRAGRYRLRYSFATDAENTVRLLSDNGVDFEPASFIVSPENASGEVSFLLFNEANNFRAEADYGAGTFLRCEAMTLTGGACTDRLFTISFFLATIAVFLVFGEWIARRISSSLLVCILFAALMASIPCLKDNLGIGDDMLFHLERLSALTQGLRSGQFPVRYATYMNQGYGSVVTTFYPSAFLYPSAFMIIAGASIQYAVHALLIAVNLVTALGAYHLGRRVFGSAFAGAVCSVLYTLAVYRLTDVYTRSAVGESLAMAFLPFFCAELYEVTNGDAGRWPRLALSAAALLHAHLVTTALSAVLSLLIILPMLPRLLRERRLPRLLLAFFCTALLGVCLAAPVMTFLRQGVTGEDMVKSLSAGAMAPAQLLSGTGYDLAQKRYDSTLRSRGYEVGAPLLLSALLCLALLLLLRERGEKRDPGARISLGALVLGTLCVLAASTLFPWGALPGPVLRAVSYLQFPWRLLMIVDLCFSLCGAWALTQILSWLAEGREKRANAAGQLLAVALVLAFCLSSVIPMLTRETRKEKLMIYNRVSEQGMRFFDYSLPRTDSRTMTGELTSEGAEVLGFDRAGTNLKLRISAQAGGSVTLPVFAFDGWEAWEDGRRLPISRTQFNTLGIAIPAGGGERTVFIRYAGKPAWRFCDMISLLALIALLLPVPGRRKER